jgi:aryl-alcohol dehydrogenase-like predicted oxidoreductase
VSRLAFGTWQLGGDWGRFEEDQAIAAIRRARALGINFFDTAQGYGWGASERMLGRALEDELRRNRADVVVASKGGLRMNDGELVRDSSREWLRRGVEESLHALGTDYLDLYQVHWPDPGVPFAETAGALQELVEAGKIRHIGVSNFGAPQIAQFSSARSVEAVQPPYSILRREIEKDVLPYALEHDLGVLVYGPLAHGLLTGSITEDTTFAPDDWRSKSSIFRGETLRRELAVVRDLERLARERDQTVSQLAIAWVLAHPAVHVAIVGSRDPAHIGASVAALDTALTKDDLARIDEIVAGAASIDGPSPETV